MAGLKTNGWAWGTAKAAADEDSVSTAVEDGRWNLTEGLHDTLCQNELASSVNVLSCEEWIQAWELV